MNDHKSIFKVILTKCGKSKLRTVLGETASEEEALDVKKEIEAEAPGTEVTIEQC